MPAASYRGGVVRKSRMTEAGEEALREEREGVVAFLERVMADWPEEDIARLRRLPAPFRHGDRAAQRPSVAPPLSPRPFRGCEPAGPA